MALSTNTNKQNLSGERYSHSTRHFYAFKKYCSQTKEARWILYHVKLDCRKSLATKQRLTNGRAIKYNAARNMRIATSISTSVIYVSALNKTAIPSISYFILTFILFSLFQFASLYCQFYPNVLFALWSSDVSSLKTIYRYAVEPCVIKQQYIPIVTEEDIIQ